MPKKPEEKRNTFPNGLRVYLRSQSENALHFADFPQARDIVIGREQPNLMNVVDENEAILGVINFDAFSFVLPIQIVGPGDEKDPAKPA